LRYATVDDLYRETEEWKKRAAIQPIFRKLAVVERLREFNALVAPARAVNKAKRAAGKVEIRIKTA
jgi:hypothetical protein